MYFYTVGLETNPDLVLPSSSYSFSDEEESELFIKETLQSQKEFHGVDLNQVVNRGV